jgi:predicted  nucleic acid-binding Zn-ribbon protein
MNIEKLNSLTRIDFVNFIPSENNVKYKIVIPFLQAFNHVDLDLEHAAQGSRIDINIGNKIIVETKALGQKIDMHVQQLSDYSGKELPVLAILTNGRHFRIYSPQWRYWRTFREKIIYEFELKDLNDTELLNRLEKILGFSNYKSEEFFKHVEEREREILKNKNEIIAIQNSYNDNLSSIESRIKEIEQEVKSLQENANIKQKEIEDLKNSMNIEIKNLEDKYLYSLKADNSAAIRQVKPAITQIENEKVSSASYLPSYILQIYKEGTLANKMLNYIRERNCVTWDEVIKEMTEKHGYKESGSLGASFKALETEGIIRVEGSKSKGKIYFVKDKNKR